MMKSWIVYILVAIGAVVVGLYIFRKVNPPPVTRVSSGGPGSQNTVPGGYRRETDVSVIEIGPATITPAWEKDANKLMTWLEDI